MLRNVFSGVRSIAYLMKPAVDRPCAVPVDSFTQRVRQAGRSTSLDRRYAGLSDAVDGVTVVVGCPDWRTGCRFRRRRGRRCNDSNTQQFQPSIRFVVDLVIMT